MATTSIDAQLKCPFNMLVAGPTQSGKSTWAGKLLSHAEELLERPPRRIHWYAPHSVGSTIPTLANLCHHKGLPWNRAEEEEEEEGEPREGDVVVIDDFAQETANSKELTAFLTRSSHHQNISVLVLTQNLFWGGKETRTQSLNYHYIVLMRQTRDHNQVRTLGRQLTQSEKEFRSFLAAYNDATGTSPFSYLLISMHPRDDKRLLLRSLLFPGEGSGATVVYLIKKYKREEDTDSPL